MSERDHVFERDMGVITLLLERLRDEQGIDYVLLSRGKYEGLADRVTELEAELAKLKRVVAIAAYEATCKERWKDDTTEQSIKHYIRLWLEEASEQIANAAQDAPQPEGDDGGE